MLLWIRGGSFSCSSIHSPRGSEAGAGGRESGEGGRGLFAHQSSALRAAPQEATEHSSR